MGVGRRIVERRKELRMSQNALARKAGISQSGLSTIESEKNGATAATLQAIAAALDCSVTYLVDETENQLATNGSELDEKLISLLCDLSPSEVQRVQDFVAGLKATRTE